MPKPITQGDIVWVRLGPRGNYKPRPAFVLTKYVADPRPDTQIVVMAGSTDFDPEIAPNEVELPGYPGRHPLTKLNKPCRAICDWVEKIMYGEIEEVKGKLPGSTLYRILNNPIFVAATKGIGGR